jgi:hypothetical protein
MKAICCNHCKQIISEDDSEAVEIGKIYQRYLERGDFILAHDEQIHYCGKCKDIFYDEWL